jgi:GxxExxY protein
MYKLTEQEQYLSTAIVESAYQVHKKLGPGLLEKVYEVCFCHELSKKNIIHKRQVNFPICYDEHYFDEGLRVDVIIDDLVICELKAIELVNPVWEAQVLSHLKLTGKHVGFLINFNVSLIKKGIRRYCME